jgi:hypothetical protein
MMVGQDDNATLDGMVFYLEDPEEDMIKSQAFRVLASGQNEATVVKDQEVLDLKVKGKPVIIVTSMNTTIDLEGERRWDAIPADTSEACTKLVIKEKLRRRQIGARDATEHPLAQAIQKLKPYEVIIPYAEQLYPYFEKTPSLIMRTQIDKFSDYIASSAVLHQYQREKDDKGRLIANDFDYLYAKFIFNVLGDAEGGMLNPIERKMVEILRTKGEPITMHELAAIPGFPRSVDWLYKHQDDLKARHIIGETSTWHDKANKQVTKVFCDIGASGFILPKGLVVFGCIAELHDQNKRGCIGCSGFINILKELNENRVKMSLSQIRFDDLDDLQKNLDETLKIVIQPIKPYDLSVGGRIIDQYDQNTTNEKTTEGQQKKPQYDRICEIKDYCAGKDFVSIAALNDHFRPSDVSHLIESGLLVKIPNNEGFDNYRWCG